MRKFIELKLKEKSYLETVTVVENDYYKNYWAALEDYKITLGDNKDNFDNQLDIVQNYNSRQIFNHFPLNDFESNKNLKILLRQRYILGGCYAKLHSYREQLEKFNGIQYKILNWIMERI
jgi:hypothetical protein